MEIGVGGRNLRRVVAALSAGVVGLVSVASASGSGPFVGGRAATVHSRTPSRSVSATVTVSAIYCGAVGRRQYAGQRSGVELLGRYRRRNSAVQAFDFAGYYSFCRGNQPVYTPEFIFSNTNTGYLRFRPAHFRIAPGDPLQVTVWRVGRGLRLRIVDLNTRQTRSLRAPALNPNLGWAAGAFELFGNQFGRPYLNGWAALINLYSPTGGPNAVRGPVPWAPMVFTHLRVDGHIVGRNTPRIALTTWRVGGGVASATVRPRVRATIAGTQPTNATVTPPVNGSFESNDGGLPAPVLGKNVDITPVTGDVRVRVTGQHTFRRVAVGAQVPNGSEIDASHGSVQMTLALPHGSYESGVFYDGRFELHQDRSTGATTATLSGGPGAQYCPVTVGGPNSAVGIASRAVSARGAVASVASATATVAKAKGRAKGKGTAKGNAKPKGKKLQSLWANAHGSFTTKGSGGAAAVLGTKWYTENTCAGTYFRVVRDKIRVTAYYPHPHTVVVTAGHSFFAPDAAVPIIQVSPVSTTGGHFNVRITDTYRLTVVSPEHPFYVDAAVAPNLPGNGTTALFPDGSVNGIPRWYVLFNITPNLINFQYWNVGVQIGSKLYLVRLRVHG